MDKIRSVLNQLKNELKEDPPAKGWLGTSKTCMRGAPRKFDKRKIRKKQRKIDKLVRRGKMINRKCHNLAMDTIHKIVNKVSEEYQYVHTSPFNVQNMVKKKNLDSSGHERKRKIRRQTVRDIHGWLHYQFKQVLKHKENVTTGMKVEILSEYLTTKSCDNCGTIRENLGGNKIFKCYQCNHEVNRDVHGARNHALRNCVGRYTLT